MRRAARVDENHALIKKAFLQMSCSVADLSRLGGGLHDLLVAIPHVNFLVEVKSATGKLTEKQKPFHRDWKGPKAIVRTVAEAALLVGWMGEMARAVAKVEQQRETPKTEEVRSVWDKARAVGALG
jgi:hypothetical protein